MDLLDNLIKQEIETTVNKALTGVLEEFHVIVTHYKNVNFDGQNSYEIAVISDQFSDLDEPDRVRLLSRAIRPYMSETIKRLYTVIVPYTVYEFTGIDDLKDNA